MRWNIRAKNKIKHGGFKVGQITVFGTTGTDRDQARRNFRREGFEADTWTILSIRKA